MGLLPSTKALAAFASIPFLRTVEDGMVQDWAGAGSGDDFGVGFGF